MEPIDVTEDEKDTTTVEVHQLVTSLGGDILSDQVLFHVYTTANGLIERMDIGVSEPAFGNHDAG